MSKPVVAIVGRPNVGKSTLFNVLAGEMISIVKDTPGVTRDRIYADVDWLDREFTLIDTGGIEPDSRDIILSQMREQAQIAIDTADVIIFITDVKQGLVDSDSKVADMLRRSGKPVVLVVNKVDNFDKYMADVYEFYNLGIGDPIPISAASRLGLGDMLDAVIAHFPESDGTEEDDDRPRVAIVGKPNVGKSSLINRLLGEQRVIVSDIAGTTRDAIDTPFFVDDKEYMIIDTAGIRKKGKIYEDIEKYSILRALSAIDRSNVVLFLIDGEKGIREQDKHVAGLAHDAGKGVIIVYNKWDTVEKDEKTMSKIEKEIRAQFLYLSYAPIAFTSALTGSKVNQLIPLIDQVHDACTLRIPTNVLNDVILDAQMMNPAKPHLGKQLKIYYASQVAVEPPTIVLFVNDPELLHFSYSRYIENKLREAFGFTGTPIKILARKRS